MKVAHDRFRFGLLGWKVTCELPDVVNLEAATAGSRPEQMLDIVACGPDPAVHVQRIQQYLDAGFDELAIRSLGDEQDRFLPLWNEELAPRLTA